RTWRGASGGGCRSGASGEIWSGQDVSGTVAFGAVAGAVVAEAPAVDRPGWACATRAATAADAPRAAAVSTLVRVDTLRIPELRTDPSAIYLTMMPLRPSEEAENQARSSEV